MMNLFYAHAKWVRASVAALVVFLIGAGTANAAAPAQAGGGNIFDNLIFVVIGGILLALFASLAGGAVIAALAVLGSRFFRRNLPTDEEMAQFKTELTATGDTPQRKIKVGPTSEPFLLSAVAFVVCFILFSVVVNSTPTPIFGEEVEGGTEPGAPAAPALPIEGDLANITDGLPEGNPANGEKLFTSAGCIGCHSQKKDERMVGPSFYNLWDIAATRVPGLSSKEYLYQSIVDPNKYVVDTFQPNIMQQNYAALLSPQQMADILAWIEERHSNEP
jgi:cytochrome c551/c552